MEEVTQFPQISFVYMKNGNAWTVEGSPTTVRTFMDAAVENLMEFCSLRSAENGTILFIRPEQVSEIAQGYRGSTDPGEVRHLEPVA